jgi:RNA polymerase sigma-70 factor (ECF subfamily)
MLPIEDNSALIAPVARERERPLATAASESEVEGLDESVLVTRLAAFDPEAWNTVFERYFTSIFRLAYVRTRHHGVAEDIAAQTFAEAAQGIRRYRYRGVPFRAWLYRIARNLTSDHLKAERRRPQVSLEQTSPLETPAVESDTYVDLLAAMDELTEEQKAAITLRLVDGYSLAEVAAIMGKSVGAVKQLQYRAIGTLQQQLSAGQIEGLRR